MSSADTVLRVLSWAQAPDGPPPQGDAEAAHRVGEAPHSLRAALGELVAVTTARLRLGHPPLGDPQRPTPYATVLALAVGIRHLVSRSRVLLAEPPPCRSISELVARHGVVEPALPYLPEKLADECLLTSPLTGLFTAPAPGAQAESQAVASRLRSHRAGRSTLVLTLAHPTSSERIRRWRTELLDRWRAGSDDDCELVMDVYETMMVLHGPEALDQIGRATAVLSDALDSRPAGQIEDALSIARWWGPLWNLERGNVARVRARHYLGYDYRRGLQLFTQVHRRASV